jgi:hypothetical protein
MNERTLTANQKSSKVLDFIIGSWTASFDGTPEAQMEALEALTDDPDYFYIEELADCFDKFPREKWFDAVATIVQRRKQLPDWRKHG